MGYIAKRLLTRVILAGIGLATAGFGIVGFGIVGFGIVGTPANCVAQTVIRNQNSHNKPSMT
ncbi:MAG TPA: hypothetical protein VE890_16510, partial [Thermoguttaceae bacterium]|nr:hypothetical protein [Thermoguttaceae bacterium]